MHKSLLFFMVCLAIGLAVVRREKDRKRFEEKDPLQYWGSKPFQKDRKFPKFCSNDTIAQVYLKEILSVIDELQANATYSSIFKSQSANFIAYLKDTVTQGLAHSDCEGFIKGLKAAKKADKEAEREQKQLARAIEKQLKQVIYSINNGKEFEDLDS